MATKAPTKPERASERAMRETQGGRAAAKPAPYLTDELIADAKQKAIDVLLQKYRWTNRRLGELDRDIGAALRRHERLVTESTEVDAERTALIGAIRQLGGDPDAQPTTEASS